MNNLHQLSKSFHGKLLLAGEYTVIEGGSSIALPLSSYSARLIRTSDAGLDELWHKMIFFFKESSIELNYDLFHSDIVNGLGYESDIPDGYGAGSSGALIAALYDRYHTKDLQGTELQSYLGKMENFFHGKSSGIDPFVIYTNHTVLTKNGKSTFTPIQPDLTHWFLLDSGITRSTAEYVEIYKKSIWPENKEKIGLLLNLNETLINEILVGQIEEQTIYELSLLQFDLFKAMIPSHVFEVWKQGLETKQFYLKLCGAGGGGFFLIFSKVFPKNIQGVAGLAS